MDKKIIFRLGIICLSMASVGGGIYYALYRVASNKLSMIVVDLSAIGDTRGVAWALKYNPMCAQIPGKTSVPSGRIDSRVTYPLHVAANQEIAKLLLDAGADIKATDDEWRMQNPIHAAVVSGRIDVVTFLIAAGANIDEVGIGGCPPLSLAALNGHTDLVKLLIAEGAGINSGSQPPLSVAANKEIAKLLMDAGADWKDPEHYYGCGTVFHAAAANGNRDVVALLIEAGADVNTEFGIFSPLFLAALCGQKEVIRVLVEAGADVSLKAITGDTPFHLVLMNSMGSESIKILIAAGADVNVKGSGGDRPLHFAISREEIETLIAAGADVNAIEYHTGKTPLDRMLKRDHSEELIQLLRAHGGRTADELASER